MKSQDSLRHLMIIDPARRVAEIECLNQFSFLSPIPVTYHLPQFYGVRSLLATPPTIGAIVILGSGSSVHDNADWQRQFNPWLMEHMKRGIPTLGLCYGHQLIAHLFGGTVGFLREDQSKREEWAQVVFSDSRPWNEGTYRLLVTHREVVQKPGPELEVFARSPSVSIEGLRHRTLPVWGLQSHPEAVPAFLENQSMKTGFKTGDFDGGWALIRQWLASVLAPGK